MATTYQDYYGIFGIARNATADEIKKAYRKLARKYHPDINKEKTAEDNFKKVTEAYEVLRDPEKRKLYDQLGHEWKNGQDFRQPPEWNYQHFDTGSDNGEPNFNKGFSDFFETLFGAKTGKQGRPDSFATGSWNLRGQDHEAKIEISLEEAYLGVSKGITLQSFEIAAKGRVTPVTRNYQIKIPKGITDGTRIRMTGKGGPGVNSGLPGDLYLKVNFMPHPRFKAVGHALNMDVPVTPWEAALGATVTVRLLDGEIHLKIPAGIQSGKKMRIKGKGMPKGKNGYGDLYASIIIVMPSKLTQKQMELFAELSKTSDFNPRDS